MVRKARDLFELLEARRKASGSPARARRKRVTTERPGLMEQVWGVVAGLTSARAPAAPVKRKVKEPSGLRLSGPLLSALILASVGVGFLLGRGTAGAGGGEELRAQERSGASMEQPGQLPRLDPPHQAPPDLTIQEESKTLSNYFGLVLAYRDTDREGASKLAHYLRLHGFADSARIRLMPLETEGEFLWGTLIYVRADQDRDALASWAKELERLRAVPAPDFEPRFAERVRQNIELKQIAAGG